ncbi:MAG: Maf family protein [Gemmatimonadetes bacterium]|nr:Maf family protein [Gemmatimonadota bacterium]
MMGKAVPTASPDAVKRTAGLPDIVLASASPRRAAVLRMLGLTFSVVPADVEERREQGEPPRRYVERLSRAKVRRVMAVHADALVIGGDTVVATDGCVLEKPRDGAGAVRMLSSLSGSEHEVYSGLAVAAHGRIASNVAAARVIFRTLTREVIEAYVATGEPLDKAGAYGVQGIGASLVERIEGDYYTVVGLSVAAFVDLIPAVGFEYLPGGLAAFALPEGRRP